jgi:hypothetical protein
MKIYYVVTGAQVAGPDASAPTAQGLAATVKPSQVLAAAIGAPRVRPYI